MTVDEVIVTGSGTNSPIFFRIDPDKKHADKGDFGINLQENFCYVPEDVYYLIRQASVRTIDDFAIHVLAFPTFYKTCLNWDGADLERAKIKMYAATGIEELISDPKPKPRSYGALNSLPEITREDIDKSKPSDFEK